MVDGNGLLGVTPSPDKASRTTCLCHEATRAGHSLGKALSAACAYVPGSGGGCGTSYWQLGFRFARLRGSVVVPLAAACCPLSLSGRGVQPGGYPPSMALWPSTLPVPNAGAGEFGIMMRSMLPRRGPARIRQIMIITSTSVSAPGTKILTLVNVTVRPAAGPLGKETQ